MMVALIIYFVFPNYQSLRVDVYEEDIFSQMVRLLQSYDSSSSVCPSLHVAVCTCVYLGIKNSNSFRNEKIVKSSAFVLTVLICMSTVFIKQHSVVDVGAGMALSSFAYVYVYKLKAHEQLNTFYRV
jgi:membrane-associated phospholipid phosphatase